MNRLVYRTYPSGKSYLKYGLDAIWGKKLKNLRYDIIEEAVERLAEYEDSNLTPAECAEFAQRAKPNQPESDVINHPSHYADKQIEVIDYMRDTLTREQFEGYCIGNVIKYISRYRKKGGAEDLKKARVYLEWVIELIEEGKNENN